MMDVSASWSKSTACVVVMRTAAVVVMGEVNVLPEAGVAEPARAFEVVLADGLFQAWCVSLLT